MNSSAHSARSEWQFINSGFHSGSHNMLMDESLAQRLMRNEGVPTLRVYGWKPHAISLGYNQCRHDFDEAKCAAHGIDIVRRPTGGRAILHAEELTYSVVMFANGKSITDVYCEISKALVCGLRLLGADVDYTPTQPNFLQIYRSQTSIPCFASSARYEIQYRGKKLVGSAQRRYVSDSGDDVVLQHGSILLGAAHKKLSELVRVENEEVYASIQRDLEVKTIELESILDRKVLYDEAAVVIRKGFEHEWNFVFTESDVDESQLNDEEELVHHN